MRMERSAASGAFQAVSGRTVAVDFDGGSLTSDAGAPPRGQADAAVGPVDRLAACFEDHRDDRFVEHSVRTLVGRRACGIALGDEDSIERDALRGDPMMAVLAGKLRAKRRNCAPVAGKSTPSRLELGGLSSSGDGKIVHDGSAIADLLVALFLDAHEAAPDRAGLDFDAADDPVHGSQEGRFFHGYYDCYCCLPLGPMRCSAPCAASASPTPASPPPRAEAGASNRSRSPHGFASASTASRSQWTRTIPFWTSSAPREDDHPPPQLEAAHNSPFPATNGDIAKPNRPSPADGRSDAPRKRRRPRKPENYRGRHAAPSNRRRPRRHAD